MKVSAVVWAVVLITLISCACFLGIYIHTTAETMRQKRTMGAMLSIAAHLTAYADIHGRYPSHPLVIIPNFTPVTDASRTLSFDKILASLARPTPLSGWPLERRHRLQHVQATLESLRSDLPRGWLSPSTLDGWGRPLLLGVTADGLHYVLASVGANGTLESNWPADQPFPSDEYWRDIVLAEGVFLATPEGQSW
jgi:hypothetical protein